MSGAAEVADVADASLPSHVDGGGTGAVRPLMGADVDGSSGSELGARAAPGTDDARGGGLPVAATPTDGRPVRLLDVDEPLLLTSVCSSASTAPKKSSVSSTWVIKSSGELGPDDAAEGPSAADGSPSVLAAAPSPAPQVAGSEEDGNGGLVAAPDRKSVV